MIGVLGGGAFGTALALTQAAAGRPVTLWARDPHSFGPTRESPRLPGHPLPAAVTLTGEIATVAQADILLLAVPMQALGPLLSAQSAALRGKALVACCKGVDLERLVGPSAVIQATCPEATPALLTGPSFAADLARGLPTALTFACADPRAAALQAALATPVLRLYLSDDLTGAELGGALKNVIALACGAVMGAGLGESARAAVMTRGFAEMTRLARALGGRPETLTGLSGFGDLALTCASSQSRNYTHGLALGGGGPLPQGKTVEGIATARAVTQLAAQKGLDLPLTRLVAALVEGHTSVDRAMEELLARPLKEE